LPSPGARRRYAGRECAARKRAGLTDAGADGRAQAQEQIAQDLPALPALGLFDVLELRDDRLRAWFDGAGGA